MTVAALAWLVGCPAPEREVSRPLPPAPDPAGCAPGRWFPDRDGDGFGGPGGVVACAAPAGHVARGGDCDDADPAAFPGAPEACDGVDQDCDGTLDDEPRVPAWPDADGDGFGDPRGEVWTCARGPDQVGIGSDCDDGDPDRRPEGPVRFVDVTVEAGLRPYLQWDTARFLPSCVNDPLGGGGAIGDFDGDGLADLFLARMFAPDALLRNRGDGTFEDVTALAGLGHTGSSNGALWFDADDDGRLDLLVTSLGPEDHRFYRNLGGGRFAEESTPRGLDRPVPEGDCALGFSAAAGDVDGDGDLDLHLTAWQEERSTSNDRSRLYLNDGAGVFTDGTLAAGLDLSDRSAFTNTLLDLEGDGDLDLFLAADWEESGLFLNDGAGRFTEVTAAAGVGTDENGMGSAIGDPDRDGDPDWFVSAVYDRAKICPEQWGCSGNRLYVNQGDGTFADGTDAAGVRDAQWGWGAAFVDWDLDGAEDLVVAGGFPLVEFEAEPSAFWRNRGDGAFEDASCATGLVHVGQARTALPFDLEGDGDPDLLFTGYGEPPRLWRNDGPAGRWLVVRPVRESGSPAIGAVVRAATPDGVQTRWVVAGGSYLGNVPAEAWFGLGAHDRADVEITWPDGRVTALPGLAAGQRRTVAPPAR